MIVAAVVPTIAVSTDLSAFLTNACGVTVLLLCYIFGVWSRNYVYPSDSTTPLRRQLIAAIPIGFISMGIYGKTALTHLDQTPDVVFEIITMLGYSVVFGMLSRESLERLLSSGGKSPAAVPPLGTYAERDSG